MIFFLLTLLTFSLDQVSKALILKSGIFVYRNSGITFGLFAGNVSAIIIYRIITYFLIFLLIGYYFLARGKKDFLTTLSLSFILGGSLGNTFDRISRGHVIDFIGGRLPFWPYDWYNNLADLFIVAGIVILFLNKFSPKKD